MADNKATSEIRVNYNGKAAERGLHRLQGSLGSAGGAVASFAKRFGPAAVATTLLVGTVIKLKSAMEFVRERTTTFEKSLSRVRAILKPTANEFDLLTKKAKELGATTAFTAGQAADAFVELGKLGLSTNEILESSDAVLSLAAASQVELAEAATVTAQTLAQFSLEAEESTRVTDVMAKSFNISALDLNKFSEAMKFAGPVAKQLGISVEETTAALAELASQGISGSMAGTALRRVLLGLGDEASTAGKLIGLTADDTRTFAERLQALQEKQLSPGEIKKTFGLLAATSAGILIKGAENVKDFRVELEDANGTAKDMADTMLDNVAGATKILESAQESLAIAIGESFSDGKRERIELMTKLTLEFKDAIKDIRPVLSALDKAMSATFRFAAFQIKGATLFARALMGATKEQIQVERFLLEVVSEETDKEKKRQMVQKEKNKIIGQEDLLVKKLLDTRKEMAKEENQTTQKRQSFAIQEAAITTKLNNLRKARVPLDEKLLELAVKKSKVKTETTTGGKGFDEKASEEAAQKAAEEARKAEEKRLKEMERFKRAGLKLDEEIANASGEIAQRQIEIDEENAEKEKQIAKDLADFKIKERRRAFDDSMTIASSVLALQDLSTQKQIDNLDKLNLSDEEREKKREEIMKDSQDKARIFARAQQAIIIAQTTANAIAMGVGAARDTFGGPITRGLAMGAAIAEGMVQVAAIQAQRFQSGRVGDVTRSRQKDDIPALIGRGETVVPAPQTAMHQEELRAIVNNTANTAAGVRNGGGNTIVFQGVSTEQMLQAQLNINRRQLTGTKI